jgi:hypothetical protein
MRETTKKETEMRTTTKQMERAVRRLYRYAEILTHNDLTTMACVDIGNEDGFVVSFRMFTHRNDCEEYSPRQVLCRKDFGGWITRYGKIVVTHDSSMTTDDHNIEALFHAKMLRGEWRNFSDEPTHAVAVRYYQRYVRGNFNFDNRKPTTK